MPNEDFSMFLFLQYLPIDTKIASNRPIMKKRIIKLSKKLLLLLKMPSIKENYDWFSCPLYVTN
jgi:hypothetical protein